MTAIGPVSPESTHYPKHGEAAVLRVATGEAALGIVVCGSGQGMKMVEQKVKSVECGG